MSSTYVRTEFNNFMAAYTPTQKIVQLAGVFEYLTDHLTDQGVGAEDTWIGLEYFGDDEVPITVGADNVKGRYRETGSIYIHVVGKAKIGGATTLLALAESLRSYLRGRRIGFMTIESTTPANTERGAVLEFEGGWMAASFLCYYENEINL